MSLLDSDMDAHLKRLHLANTRRTWRELVVRAEHAPDHEPVGPVQPRELDRRAQAAAAEDDTSFP